MPRDKIIILLDSHAILHRFYHALPRLESPDGTPTQAVYGLTNLLIKVIDEYNPIRIFACFDRPEMTHRHSLYKEYKGTRPETKDDLKVQISLAKKVFEKFNIPVFEKAGYEAEDLIGSIIEKIKQETEAQIIVITGDLDTLQLVENEKILVCLLKKGFSETDTYDENRVFERFGFSPKLLPDYKALTGDQSDNIKGISGIGEKRGSDLIKKFGPVESIIEQSESIKEEKIKKGILENKDIVLLNKNLTTINRNLEIELPADNYMGINKEKILPFLKELNFKSVVQRLEARQDLNNKKRQSDINIDERREIEFETNLEKFEQSLLANLENIIFLINTENLYVKSDQFYKLIPNAAILKKILNHSSLKITFDLKKTFKQIFQKNPVFDQEIDLSQIRDLKLAFSLVYSNSTAINLIKILSFHTGKSYNENEAIFDFLEFGHEALINLEQKINELNLTNIYQLERSLIPVLARMEKNGLLFNVKNIDIFKNFLFSQLKRCSSEIISLAGIDFNINSHKALRKILFERLKISTKGIAKTPKGEISTSESELLKMRNSHPLIEKILEYRELNKIFTTYTDSLKNLINPNTNRLHTHFEQIGTVTGRITSQNPNLQNIPVKGELANQLRRCFEAEKGFSLIGLDYAQMELRLAAHLSGDENLTVAFQGNIDVHSLAARLLFKNNNEKSRRFAKIINFGIIYGISAQGLKERLRISRDEAQKIIQDYFLKFPGLKKMRDEFIEKTKIQGYAETLLGRKRIIPEINSGSFREKAAAERAAINMPIQGLSADIIKKSLIDIDKFLIEKKFYPDRAKIVLQIYDSIALEAQDDIINEVQNEAKKIMENACKLSVPLLVKVDIGKDLSQV